MPGPQTTIVLPPDVRAALSANGYVGGRLEKEFRLYLAAGFFRKKLLSLGKACQLADTGMWEFIDFLGELGIPLIDYDDEEIEREIESAEWLTERVKHESNS